MEGDMLKVVITVIALLVVLYYLSSGILSLFGKGASASSEHADRMSDLLGTG